MRVGLLVDETDHNLDYRLIAGTVQSELLENEYVEEIFVGVFGRRIDQWLYANLLFELNKSKPVTILAPATSRMLLISGLKIEYVKITGKPGIDIYEKILPRVDALLTFWSGFNLTTKVILERGKASKKQMITKRIQGDKRV